VNRRVKEEETRRHVTVIAEGKDAPTGSTVRHCLSLSFGLAVMASVAAYVLAFLLFTIHEEIGISADAALPIAVWTFLTVFLGSLIGYLARKAGLGRR
jgi:hypothetical protein